MKHSILIAALCFTLPLAHAEETVKPAEAHAKFKEGTDKVADDQDNLSADVEQLATEQTVPKVIELLTQVENIMDEATENLSKANTSGETLAAQTEIIEKIHEAAKAKQSSSGSKTGSAMMDMMERMMGKNPEGGKPNKGNKPDNKKGGGGTSGDSTSGNEAVTGAANGEKPEVRRVPKAAGTAGTDIPTEFRKAFDAYNRGVEKKVK